MNEREKWLMDQAYAEGYADCRQAVRDRSGELGLEMRWDHLASSVGAPADPRDARIARLEGLLREAVEDRYVQAEMSTSLLARIDAELEAAQRKEGE